jgi:flagellar M-ring protein FliF
MDAAEKILGSRDAFWATVNVELATSAIERHKNTFDPEGGVLLSETIREEESRDRGTPAGVPGAQTNLPENAAGAAGGAETEIFENTNNYQNSTVQETEIIVPGDVKRVVTSVAVNTEAIQPLITNGMTEDTIRENLRKVIQGAVGYDQVRGDDLVIEFIEFAPATIVEETSSLSTLTYSLEGLMPSLVSLVAVLLFFLGVVRPIVNKITSVEVVSPKNEEPAEAVVEDTGDLSAGELLDRVRYTLNTDMEPVDPEELNALVEKFMDSSTTVLRRWMKKAS